MKLLIGQCSPSAYYISLFVAILSPEFVKAVFFYTDGQKLNPIKLYNIILEYFATRSTCLGNTFRAQSQKALSEFKTSLILFSK